MFGLMQFYLAYLIVIPAVTLLIAVVVHLVRYAWLRKRAVKAVARGTAAAAPSLGTAAAPPIPVASHHGFHLKWFDARTFIGGMFRHHARDEAERALSRGYLDTTPPLRADMAALRSPWLAPRLFLLLFGSLVLILIVYALQGNLLNVPAFDFLGAAAIPLSVLVAFYEYNSPDNVSLLLLARFVVLGGVLGVLITVLLYFVAMLQGVHQDVVIAGPVEETAKLLAVLLLFRKLDHQRYPYVLNGLLFGAALGTGFAIIETAGYILTAAVGSSHVMGDCLSATGSKIACLVPTTSIEMVRALPTMGTRGLMAPFNHVVWTSLAAGLYWWERSHRPHRWRLAAFCVALLGPVILHTWWDNFAGTLASYLAVGTIGWFLVLEILRLGYLEVWNLTRTPDPATADGAAAAIGPAADGSRNPPYPPNEGVVRPAPAADD